MDTTNANGGKPRTRDEEMFKMSMQVVSVK